MTGANQVNRKVFFISMTKAQTTFFIVHSAMALFAFTVRSAVAVFLHRRIWNVPWSPAAVSRNKPTPERHRRRSCRKACLFSFRKYKPATAVQTVCSCPSSTASSSPRAMKGSGCDCFLVSVADSRECFLVRRWQVFTKVRHRNGTQVSVLPRKLSLGGKFSVNVCQAVRFCVGLYLTKFV